MAIEFSIESNSEEETCAIARKIARFFHPGDAIILDGDLGAGKTYFVKGFTAGLQSKDLVSSPTFSIANFYRTDTADILHIDLYRISFVEEFKDLGLLDYFEQSVVLIEWGKKFAEYFDAYFLISFEINDDTSRTITFSHQDGRADGTSAYPEMSDGTSSYPEMSDGTSEYPKTSRTMAELKKILKGDALC